MAVFDSERSSRRATRRASHRPGPAHEGRAQVSWPHRVNRASYRAVVLPAGSADAPRRRRTMGGPGKRTAGRSPASKAAMALGRGRASQAPGQLVGRYRPPVAQHELDQDLASRAPRAPARRRRWPPLPKETRQLGVAGYSGGARHFRGLGATCGRGAAERVQRRRIRPLACAIRALFDKELTPHPRESGKPRGVNRRLVPRANCMSRWEVLSAVIRRPLLLLLLLLLRLQLQWTLRHVGPVLTHFHHRRE